MIKFSKIAIATVAALSLAACGDDDDNNTTVTPVDTEIETEVEVEIPVDTTVEYQFTFTNLTNGQPISPPAVLLHSSDDASDVIWTVGVAASTALELLAESGDSSELVASSWVDNSFVSEGPALPGTSVNVTVNYASIDDVNYFSFASMLGNTNDAFTGLNKIDLSELAIDQSLNYRTPAYDAGTEANSETVATVPGPASADADGVNQGEAYNSERDDVDIVAMHSGVVTQDDGLTTSVLTYQQKFDNPVMSVTITRTK